MYLSRKSDGERRCDFFFTGVPKFEKTPDGKPRTDHDDCQTAASSAARNG
jgi:hypothetical protein